MYLFVEQPLSLVSIIRMPTYYLGMIVRVKMNIIRIFRPSPDLILINMTSIDSRLPNLSWLFLFLSSSLEVLSFVPNYSLHMIGKIGAWNKASLLNHEFNMYVHTY